MQQRGICFAPIPKFGIRVRDDLDSRAHRESKRPINTYLWQLRRTSHDGLIDCVIDPDGPSKGYPTFYWFPVGIIANLLKQWEEFDQDTNSEWYHYKKAHRLDQDVAKEAHIHSLRGREQAERYQADKRSSRPLKSMSTAELSLVAKRG